MGIDTGSYSYNISASADNTAYLWSGHGLTNAENPTLYFRDGDIVTISKIGGGHPLKISNDADQSFVLESGGVLLLEPIEEGTYTYVCTSHAAMTGKILVGARYQGEGPDEGFGTGLLPTRNSPISVNQIRTKINEIITKGGVGGGKVTVSESPPDFPSEGNLWYDSSFAALFAYLEDYGWVQTNGAMGRAKSVIVNSSEPSDAQENDFWFDTINNVLKIYISGAWYAAAQTTQTSSSGGDNSGASVDVSSTQPTNPESGDLWFNSSNSSLSVFSSGSWFRVDSRVLVTNLTPTSSNAGDFWLNTDNNILSVNNGTSLVAINRIEIPIYDSNNRPTDAVNGDLFFNTDTSLVEVYNNAQWVSSGVPSSDFIEELGKIPSDISNLTDSSGLLSSGANVTTSIDYPNDPSDGDLWFNESVGSLFVYIDGTGWVESNPGGGSSGGSSSGGGASVTTGETAPTSPTDGDLWYDTSVAKLYVYIDGAGWFQANGGSSGGGSKLVSIPRAYLNHLPNQDTTFNATDYGVPAGATHIQGYALISSGSATITVNAGTEYNADNAFIIIKGSGAGIALIPLDENGNFHVRITDIATSATVRGFSILGYMSSSSGGGGGGGGTSYGLIYPSHGVLQDNGDYGIASESNALASHPFGIKWLSTAHGANGGYSASGNPWYAIYENISGVNLVITGSPGLDEPGSARVAPVDRWNGITGHTTASQIGVGPNSSPVTFGNNNTFLVIPGGKFALKGGTGYSTSQTNINAYWPFQVLTGYGQYTADEWYALAQNGSANLGSSSGTMSVAGPNGLLIS